MNPFEDLERSMFKFCQDNGLLPSEVELVTNDVEMTAHFKVKESAIEARRKALDELEERLKWGLHDS